LYFPFGEVWREEGIDVEKDLLGFKFTGKELDQETGYYYFGARYYEPVLSVWISADPAMEKYLPSDEQIFFPEKPFSPTQDLPGMGGVYYSVNLNIYHYAGLNPIKLIDPDGNNTIALERLAHNVSKFGIPGKVVAMAIGVGIGIYKGAQAIHDHFAAKDDAKAIPTTDAITLDQTGDKKSTLIYRFGSHTNTNLTPREKDIGGLSFTTKKPTEGKYVVTTLEAVNATGKLKAIKDSLSHVSVKPTNIGEMSKWIKSRPSAETDPHVNTKILKAITIPVKD
jgi:RHS repeat-associated protein